MTLGPIEVLEIAFPENRFTGEIIPELERLIEQDIISIVDGVFVTKDADGNVEFVEFEELDANDDAARLTDLLNQIESLISDEDVLTLAEGLEPNSSAAILAFEHTWAKPFRDKIVDAGGVLVSNFRIPGAVVEELMAELAELD